MSRLDRLILLAEITINLFDSTERVGLQNSACSFLISRRERACFLMDRGSRAVDTDSSEKLDETDELLSKDAMLLVESVDDKDATDFISCVFIVIDGYPWKQEMGYPFW